MADKTALEGLKKQTELSEKINFTKIEDNLIAGFILLFFKELPVITSDKFFEICVDAKNDVSKLKTSLNHFPSLFYRDLLYSLLKVLTQVVLNSSVNGVTSKQLARVFSPFFVPKIKVKQADALILPFETMIDQFETIFKVISL